MCIYIYIYIYKHIYIYIHNVYMCIYIYIYIYIRNIIYEHIYVYTYTYIHIYTYIYIYICTKTSGTAQRSSTAGDEKALRRHALAKGPGTRLPITVREFGFPGFQMCPLPPHFERDVEQARLRCSSTPGSLRFRVARRLDQAVRGTLFLPRRALRGALTARPAP